MAKKRTTAKNMMRKAKTVKSAVRKAKTSAVRATSSMGKLANRAISEQERLTSAAREKLDSARKQWNEADRKMSGYIRNNPKKAAAIAAGVGVALGAALAASMRDGKKR